MSDIKISNNENVGNKYDNSDLIMDRTPKQLANAYNDLEEMQTYKLYLETLEIEARMKKSTDKISIPSRDDPTKKVEVEVKSLVPRQSEFEELRRLVVSRLNGAATGGKHGANESEIKQLMADFSADNTFDLSSKITNYLLDKKRRDKVTDSFKFTFV